MIYFNLRSQNQVSVNFVEMLLPPQGSNGVCEAWVQLEEGEEHNLGTLIGGAIGQKKFRYVNIFLFLGSQKFCGLTVPNYPGPSVIMSGNFCLRSNLRLTHLWIIQVQIPSL